MTPDPPTEKRLPWWERALNIAKTVGATIAGFALLTVETVRGTYNPIAMTFAAVCLGIVSSSVLSRYLIGRWEDKGK